MNVVEELEQAAFKGDLMEVDRLASIVPDINAPGRNWNALHAAIENENYGAVVKLLTKGAAVESMIGDMTPLAHAVDIAIDGARNAGRPDEEVPTNIAGLLLRSGAAVAPGLEIAHDYRCKPMTEFLTSYHERCEQDDEANL